MVIIGQQIRKTLFSKSCFIAYTCIFCEISKIVKVHTKCLHHVKNRSWEQIIIDDLKAFIGPYHIQGFPSRSFLDNAFNIYQNKTKFLKRIQYALSSHVFEQS